MDTALILTLLSGAACGVLFDTKYLPYAAVPFAIGALITVGAYIQGA